MATSNFKRLIRMAHAYYEKLINLKDLKLLL